MRTDTGTAATTPTAQAQPIAPLRYAMVEMGHARIAGSISEQNFAGLWLVKIDVPDVIVTEHPWRNGGQVDVHRVIPAHSCSFGAAAVYIINWCDEITAAAAAHEIKHDVLRPYCLLAALDGMAECERLQLPGLPQGASLGFLNDVEHRP